MSENPLVTLRSDIVKSAIAQVLSVRRINNEKFESSISLLIAEAEPNITAEVTDQILLRYRLKVACDLTANRGEYFLASVSQTCRSFGPLQKHLVRIRQSESFAELNILDLSSLGQLERQPGTLSELLATFTEPVVQTASRSAMGVYIVEFGSDVQRGNAPVHLGKAALHGSLRRLECDYGASPYAEKRHAGEK